MAISKIPVILPIFNPLAVSLQFVSHKLLPDHPLLGFLGIMTFLDEEDENLAHFLESEVLSEISDQVHRFVMLFFPEIYNLTWIDDRLGLNWYSDFFVVTVLEINSW